MLTVRLEDFLQALGGVDVHGKGHKALGVLRILFIEMSAGVSFAQQGHSLRLVGIMGASVWHLNMPSFAPGLAA